MNEMEQICAALQQLRAPIACGEYDLHACIARALAGAGFEVRHEVPLAPRCRIDFVAGATGIEVKKGRPAPAALRRQIERYLASGRIEGLIVVTERAVALPHRACGKEVRQISLNRLWGVALP